MKKGLLKPVMYGALGVALLLGSCSKDNDPNPNPDPDPDPSGETRWVTLTAALKRTTDGDGDGGTYAYAVTPEQAADPNHTVRIFDAGQGYHLKSERTARVQASEDGQYLYNIQYVGADGGIFNKYKISGAGSFEEIGNEVNTAIILGTAPRWTKATEGIGVGVYASALTTFTGTTVANYAFTGITSTVRIATLDLNNPSITNTAEFEFPFTQELIDEGYSVSRIDIPILNQAKNKIFIGCQVNKVDPTGTPTVGTNGLPAWPNDAENRTLGTVTLVVDYPSLRNPTFIESGITNLNNHSYRTMTQHLATDGHVYQSISFTGGGGPYILRIDKNTSKYDDSYEFNLDDALNVTGSRIRSWRYIKDGVAVVLYDTGSGTGGHLAIIDLNAKTGTKLSTELEAELDFQQQQGIAIVGDNVYLPLTPVTKDGNVYVINWKTKSITKGAKLVNGTGHRFIGSY